MVEIENLNKFQGQMKWTKISENGTVIITSPTCEYWGSIDKNSKGYFIELRHFSNSIPFQLARVNKRDFSENVLGYYDGGTGVWPYMKSTDDILKVLVELDKLYVFEEPKLEKPKSMEMEHPSIEDIDFTHKKKHYQLNFSV